MAHRLREAQRAQGDRVAVRVAVLDDYGSVARGLGPWERLDGRAEVEFIAEHLDDPAARLAPYEVVVAMRERTAFPRAVLDRLPSLRLLVTTGMMNASIDLDAARDRGVLVCGTGSRGGLDRRADLGAHPRAREAPA